MIAADHCTTIFAVFFGAAGTEVEIGSPLLKPVGEFVVRIQGFDLKVVLSSLTTVCEVSSRLTH
jgi:hypothetical protein